VSNWALMEKVKSVAAPIKFVAMRVKMSTTDFVRFEAELEHSDKVEPAIAALNDQQIKIGGFTQPFKTKAKKASTAFPTKSQWESHFMENAEHYDETKPGERADTLLIKDVPKRFFSDEGSLIPTEDNIRLAFLTFGTVRMIDVPMLNPDFLDEAATGAQGLVAGGKDEKGFNAFSMTGTGLNFDFFVQFTDKIGFERCMEELRDMKLMHMDEHGKAVGALITVQFDKSKHLSEAKMMAREEARKKAALEKKQREEERHRRRQEEERKLEEKERIRAAKDKEKEERRLKRQAIRRERRLKKKHAHEEKKLKRRIQIEERKLLLAQRKLEATRILEKLFDRVAKMKEAELAKKLEAELTAERAKQAEKEKRRKEKEEEAMKKMKDRKEKELEEKERELKEKLLKQVGDRKRAKEAQAALEDKDSREKDRDRKREKSRERSRRDERSSRNDEKRRKYDTTDRDDVSYDRKRREKESSSRSRDRRH